MKKHILLIIYFSLFVFSFSHDSNPTSYIEQLKHAQNAKESGSYSQALKYLFQEKELNPERLPAYFEIGKIYFEKELYESAISYFQSGLKINKNNYNCLFYKALSLSKLGQSEEAYKTFSLIEKNYPASHDYFYEYAWACLKSYRIDKAENLALILYENGQDFYSNFLLGNVYLLQNDYKKSKSHYVQALNFAETNKNPVQISSTYHNLAFLEKELSSIEQAKIYANRSIETQADYNAFLLLGDLSLEDLNLEEAKYYYKKAYNIAQNPLTQLKIAEVLLLQGELKEAEFLIAHIFDAYKQEKISLYTINIGDEAFLTQLHFLNKNLQKAKFNKELILKPNKFVINLKTFYKKHVILKFYDNVYRKSLVDESLKKTRFSKNAAGFLNLAIINKNYKKTAKNFLELAEISTENSRVLEQINLTKAITNNKYIEAGNLLLYESNNILQKQKYDNLINILEKSKDLDKIIFSVLYQSNPQYFLNNFKKIKIHVNKENKVLVKKILPKSVFTYSKKDKAWINLEITELNSNFHRILLYDYSDKQIFEFYLSQDQVENQEFDEIYEAFIFQFFGLAR